MPNSMRWSQIIFIVVIAAVTVAALWLLVSASSAPSVSAPRTGSASVGLKVGASIPPLQSIVKAIGQDKVTTIGLLPPGASPHTFEPKVSDVAKLQGARVAFVIGHGLDDWARDMVADPATLMTVDEGIALRPNKDSDEAGPDDPHYWLSFENTRQIARTIAAKLQEIDPRNAGFYAANLEKFEQEIMAAKETSRKKFEGIKNDKIVTFHDAWEYFAAEQGLTVAATFEPTAGKEPTPQYLKDLQQTVRRYQIKTIFSEPQLSTETLDAFLADVGVAVQNLDELGVSSEGQSYLDTLTADAQIIAESLK